jgi:hypothetical protein
MDDDTAAFLREKANQCRSLAEGLTADDGASRGLNAMALELDARALAIEASRVTAREIESEISAASDKSA